MKILLINASQANAYGTKMMPPYPPLGLLYIAAVLEKEHRNVELINFDVDIQNKEKAMPRLKKWTAIAHQYTLFPEFRKTLSHWLGKITNYFHRRATKGMVEGINTKIKLIKRRAFGFRNFEHFRLRVIAAFQ